MFAYCEIRWNSPLDDPYGGRRPVALATRVHFGCSLVNLGYHAGAIKSTIRLLRTTTLWLASVVHNGTPSESRAHIEMMR